MLFAVLGLIISGGAVMAGWGYVRTARRLRSFDVTRGKVVDRVVVAVPFGSREGRWGKGGGYQPKVTYEYTVGDIGYSSDRWSYATQGLKRSVAEQALRAVPDEVDVYYDPAAPQVAYLHTHPARIGYLLVIGGAIGVLVAAAALLV